jgi:hypothetical protein
MNSTQQYLNLSQRYTLNELAFRKFLRERDHINQSLKARNEINEQIQTEKLEAKIKSEKETQERLRKIAEIKMSKENFLKLKREKVFCVDKQNLEVERRVKSAKSSQNIPNKKFVNNNNNKKKLELKEKQKLESERFNKEIADKIVLIKYQRLPNLLNLINKSFSIVE